ncbi:MAG TPA: hypothetical protein VGQ41_23865 [Pyrinomonadaceae bacterium]|nr:hypothetical protein [Pyrinomonadaceae bacterium]
MKRVLMTAAVIIVCVNICRAQSQELPKFEVAGEFTTLERDSFTGNSTEPGFGGRFTFNLNRIVSLETAGYFFPKRCLRCRDNGRITEVLGGVKVGKRFESWGIFVKARPGVVSFSEGDFNIVPAPAPADPSFPFQFEINRTTNFATDFGAVVEFYPSKRIVTRFDAGDTLIHFNSGTRNVIQFIPSTNSFLVLPLNVPSRTTHSFQFMASVGFRF